MTMARRLGVLACVVILLLAIISPAFAEPIGNARDEFGAISYSGNDGSLSWSDDWRETPLANGPSAGEIRVVGDARCTAANCLRIGPGNVTGQGVHREVDLSAAATATLTFDSRRQLDDGSGGRVHVAVSSNGWSWTPLVEYTVDRSDASFVPRSVDLSDWVGGSVRVGFFGTGNLGGYFYVDNVDVTLSTNVGPRFVSAVSPRADGEGDSISFTPSAIDPDDGVLSFGGSGLPPGISVDPATGRVSGTIGFQAASASPFSSVLYVADPEGATDSVSFTWAVANENLPPTLSEIADRTIDESTPLSVTVDADDPDLPDDALTYSLVNPPQGATISQAGVVKWTPGESAGPGQYTLTVRVEDAASPPAAIVRSFQVQVAEVNLPPRVEPVADMALRPGDDVSVAIDWSDPDLPANTVTFSAVGLPPGISMDSTSGRLHGSIADGADLASGTVTITAIDDGFPVGRTITTFSWQIGTGNRPPVLAPIADQEMGNNGLVEFVADAADADSGDSVSYWLAAGIDPVPEGAAINASTGAFSWRPTEAQHNATYRINVGVSDSGSPRLSDTQLITIVVPEYNQPPSIASVSDQTTAEGESVLFSVSAADENETDRLRFSATGLPEGLRINSATGAVSGTVGFDGSTLSPYFVKVSVTDDGVPSRSATTTFSWSITDTNRPPEAPPLEIVAMIGDETIIELPAVDPDGDELQFAVVDPPILGMLTGEAPEFIYTSIGGASDKFTYMVSDGEFEVEGTVTIELRSSNVPPQATLDEYEVATDAELIVTAPGVLDNDVDLDGEALTAVVVANPDHGDLELSSDGSFRYLPESGYSGADKFTYAAVDALDERSEATVIITIGSLEGAVLPITGDDGGSSGAPSVRSVIVGATSAVWQPTPEATGGFTSGVLRSSAGLLRGVTGSIAAVRLPLALLAALMLLALTVGRMSVVPAGPGKSQEEGRVGSYDADHGFGRLIPDGDGEDVFVRLDAFGPSAPPLSGQRVEFIAADIRGRRIALKVWAAT